jgi:thiosulfate/3-mercaptopyruvate sulfurtransferase
MAAARLWWLLNWAGHEAVAVLDGGLARWIAEGFAVTASLAVTASPADAPPADAPRTGTEPFVARYRPELTASANDLVAGGLIIDARAADRFRGENETVDPVAGHIPGAVSMPFTGNLGRDGRLLPPEDLQQRYLHQRYLPQQYAGAAGQDPPIFYCGSGVTAAHNLLAYRRAGYGMARLYPGSWSEWITDPNRPVER